MASEESVHPFRIIAMSHGCGPDGVTALDQKHALVRNIYRDIYADTMRPNDIDYIVTLAYGLTAPNLGEDHYNGYTRFWNVLDFL